MPDTFFKKIETTKKITKVFFHSLILSASRSHDITRRKHFKHKNLFCLYMHLFTHESTYGSLPRPSEKEMKEEEEEGVSRSHFGTAAAIVSPPGEN